APTASDVLSLDGTQEGFPTPQARPGTTELALVPAAPVEDGSLDATPPAPLLAQDAEPIETANPSDINNRIASAEAAPVVGSTEVAAASPVAEVAPAKPVASPPQIVASAQPTQSSAASSGGFLNSLFGKNTKRRAPPAAVAPAAKPVVAATAVTSPTTATPAKPPRVIATASASGSASALPGVNRDRALGVKQAASATLRPIQVASAAGLARLTPNGLKTQHSGVDVKCLKPALVRVLKTIEKRYGKPVIVTSGYRSPKRNASIRGAKNSLHIYCSAADIQVAGVDKWALAKYVRSMPGRGGVGTYCHTKSVHVDIGPKRDWNWRCRRR
ncbi:MAG: D-Ala-D-Ala carboxypeptidase family metallohydrolase, partial [Pseudomonadota bacterium]